MTNWIQLLNGGQYEYGPDKFMHEGRIVGPFDIEDVAVPLSHIARFLGHSRVPWSVAAHAVLVCRLLDFESVDAKLAGLHHDDHEALVGDMPAPLKWHLDDPAGSASTYAQRAIEERLGLQRPADDVCELVKRADLAALEGERRALLAECPRSWSTPFDAALAKRAEEYVRLFKPFGFGKNAADLYIAFHHDLVALSRRPA